jgi:hypothetical protein
MPAPAISRSTPASYRNSDSPADQALAKIVDLLLPAGYGFTIPAWDGDAYLRINNALRAIAALTITSHGNLTWEYRSAEYPHLQPSRLVGIAIELLDPDHTRPESVMGCNDGFPLAEIIRFYLHRYGLTATVAEARQDIGPVLSASNPDRPYRGTVEISDDGELEWRTRAPHHPDGGIPLPDIAATISRALTRAKHAPSHA